MKIIAIIQARMESTRLPGKVLMEICKKTVLGHIVTRVRKSKLLDEVIVATSLDKSDDAIVQFTKINKIKCFRGDQKNVLDRFYKCAMQYEPDIILRLTGDNVIVDSHIIDEGIDYFLQKKTLDYLYYREGLPIGMAVEIFKFSALEKAYKNATNPECIEHVTPYIYHNKEKFISERVKCVGRDYSKLRWTLDTVQDYTLISKIYESLYDENEDFHYEDVINKYKEHKEWVLINRDINQVKVQYKGGN